MKTEGVINDQKTNAITWNPQNMTEPERCSHVRIKGRCQGLTHCQQLLCWSSDIWDDDYKGQECKESTLWLKHANSWLCNQQFNPTVLEASQLPPWAHDITERPAHGAQESARGQEWGFNSLQLGGSLPLLVPGNWLQLWLFGNGCPLCCKLALPTTYMLLHLSLKSHSEL